MMMDETTGRENAAGLTLALARRACEHYRQDALDADVRRIALHSIIDWHAVCLAALTDPVHQALARPLAPFSGLGLASVVGLGGTYPPDQAALVNGATAHALDFDDVNLAMSGHPTAVIFSAALAMAQQRDSSGAELLAAFVAGCDIACAIGQLLCPDHLQRGFHSTATICIFGAAVACARLHGFDARQTAMAMGIAGTRAAGLKAVFGSMTKPLHAGLAARAGFEAVAFVAAGLDCGTDILEHPMGFARTHSAQPPRLAALDAGPPGRHLRNTLFKYEAACYGANGPIRCARLLRDTHGLQAGDVRAVRVRVDRSVGGICTISRPVTGPQAKFSLEANIAFILAGIDTGSIQSYIDENVLRPDVIALRDKVQVALQDDWPAMQAEVEIVCNDGRVLRHRHDAGLPDPDLDRQDDHVAGKFLRLATPVLGEAAAADLLQRLRGLASLPSARMLHAPPLSYVSAAQDAAS